MSITKLKAKQPAGERTTVQWGDGGFSLITSSGKLDQDAKNFRIIAKHIRSSSQTANSETYARALETMAGQYDAAAKGESPQAK